MKLPGRASALMLFPLMEWGKSPLFTYTPTSPVVGIRIASTELAPVPLFSLPWSISATFSKHMLRLRFGFILLIFLSLASASLDLYATFQDPFRGNDATIADGNPAKDCLVLQSSMFYIAVISIDFTMLFVMLSHIPATYYPCQ